MNWAERRSIYENNQKTGSNTTVSSSDQWAERRKKYNSGDIITPQQRMTQERVQRQQQQYLVQKAEYDKQQAEYNRLLGLDLEEAGRLRTSAKTNLDMLKDARTKIGAELNTQTTGIKASGMNHKKISALRNQIKSLDEQIAAAQKSYDDKTYDYQYANLYQKQAEQEKLIKEHGDYQATVSDAIDDPYYRKVNNLLGVKSKADLYSKRSQNKLLSENSGKIMSEMTDEERNTYNYIFDTEGREAAKEYMEILEYSLASRYKKSRTGDAQEMANSGFGGAAAGTALSIMEGAVSDTGGGLGFYLQKGLRDIGWADDSLPINYEKTFATSTWSNALQEQVSQNITDSGKDLFTIGDYTFNTGDAGAFLYGTGVSIADNMARNLIFAPFGSAGTLTVMAARVAGQSVNEALSRGATEEEAAAYGVSSAIGEVIGEVAPLDHLLGMVNADPKTGKEWLKAILKQAGLEASGEAITTVWNDLVSAQALGDLSDYNMAKAEYIQQGMNEAEAEKQATKDALHQIFLDALGGAISGVAMGGGASVVNRAVSRASGERAENNIASSLVSDIDESEVQKRAAKYEKKGMSTEEATQKAREDIRNKKAKEYTEQGMSAEEAAEAVKADDIATEERNKKLREEILDRGLNAEEGSKANSAAKAIQNKLKSGESVSADEWKNLIKSTRAQVSLAETKDAIKNAAQKSGESLADTDVDVMAAAMEKNFQGKNMSEAENKLIKSSEAAKKAYSELTGLNYETGEVIPEIVEEKKKAAIRDILGEQVTDYAGENRSNGYKNALSKTYRAYLSLVEEANAGDIAQLQAKLSPEGYAQLFSEFYEFGKSGEYSANVLKAGLEKRGAVRGEALKAFETAYELGRSEAKSSGIKNAKVRQAELNAKKRAEREKKATAPKGVARSITEKELKTDAAKNAGAKSIDMKRHFSQKQRYAIAVAREFAKMTDINIVFYQTEDGKGANGWYDRETDTIYIDLFSGFNNEQAMLRTLSHELTHFMEKYSPEHYEEYKQFLLEYYYNKDNGETLSRLVEQEKKLAPNQSTEYWQNEIVANASEMFINDESAMRALISEHADVAQTVDQWFKKMNYALRRAFKGVVTSGSAEADAAKELQANVEAFSEAQKRWSALLKESVEAKNAVGTAEENGDVRFSMRVDSDYMKAVESGDTETAQKLVDEAARATGYDSEPIYHGTQNFGFTKLDVSKSDDEISFFATSNPDMAQTYSGKSGTKKINEALGDINSLTEEEVVDRLNKESVTDGYGMGSKYRIMRPADVKAFLADVDKRIEKLDDVVERKTTEYADRLATDFNDANLRAHSKLVALSEALQFYNYDKMSTPLWVLLNNTDVFNSAEKKRYGNLEADIRLRNGLTAKKGIDEGAVIRESLDRYEIRVKTFEEAKNELAANAASGNYVLRGKTDGLLEIDGNGHNWNDIFATLEPKGGNTLRAEYDFSTSSVKLSDKNGEFANIPARTLSEAEPAMARAITKHYGSYFASTVFAQARDQLRSSATAKVAIKTTGKTDTRNIAQFAKEQGYRGVKITDIYDNGGRGANADTGNVYIYFYPQEDVKSADAVTYDENGKVIPLSERFNAKNDDIRYSMRAEAHEEIKKAITDKNYGYDIQLTDSSPKIILGREGVRNLPLLMKASHVRENILTESEAKKIGARINSHTHYHGLGEKLFSDVINDLENVNEAYRGTRKAESPERRENYFLLISTHSDKDGNTINVPVFINEHGLYNRVYMDTNKVATVFGRENLREYISKEVRNGNLVRIKNKSTVNSESPALIAVDYTDNALQEQYTQNEAESQQISEKNNKKSVIDGLGKVQYQLRIEDKNRLDILDKQETRLTADLKTLEKAYAEAIRAEYERSIKPGEETSRRAAEINRKAAKRYMNEVGATFHVPKDERSLYLLPIINEIIDKGPAISESEGLIEQLYREAYRHSREYVADDGALYKKERDALRNTAIYVDPGTRSDVGDYERFRKNNMGSLKLTSDPSAISLDGLYDMLANNYPDFFSGSTDGAEQLYELSAFMKNKGRVENIGDYMTEDEFVKWAMDGDSGLDTELDNLFNKTVGSFLSEASRKERERANAAKVNRAAENINNAIKNYNKSLDAARAEGVLAGQMNQGAKDAAKLRVTAESYENRIKAYRNKLSEVREKRDAALKARREAFENYKAERVDSARREVLRKRIAKGVRSLNTMLLNPTDNKHIPQDLRGAVAGFLSNFTDNSSVFSKSKLDALAKAYSQIAEESSDLNDLYDPDIKDYLDKMEKTVEGKRLSELSADELFFVQTITDYFTHIVRDGNKLLVDGRRQNISELASETVRAAEEHGLKTYRGGTLGGAVNWADKYLNYDNITPYYFFNRMGGGMKRLYNDMLYNSQLKYSQDINEDQKFMASVYEKYHVWDWSSANQKNKNDILRFETARKGAWLEMTRNEVLAAYATYKRGKALGDGAAHMKEGGIVVKSKTPEKFMQEYVKSSKGVQLDIADIQKMFRFLTDEQKACADAVVNYLTTVEGARRNETSMALYGYKKFNETYYFPYRVASDYTKSHAGQEVSPDGTKQAGGSKMLKNMGSAKALTPNANAAIVIDDFFKVVAESMNDTARYHAFAVQQDNFMRVLNYKDTVDAEHGSTSVKQAIRDSYGTEGINYITGLMGDSFGGAVQLNDDNVFGKLFGKFKKTAVAANLSVAIQQPSAIMRATAMIDGKYLTKTVRQKNILEEMYEYSSTAFLKNMGRFDIGTGRSAEQYILKPELKGKDYMRQLFATGEYSTGELDDVTGFLSEKADWVTWGHIMNAVMAEIEDTTDLKRGTEEFKRAAGRRFDEVVNATQVYDSILVKSPMMRDQRGIAQIISAFKMEPTLSYNLFVDSISKEKVAAKSAARGLSALALNVFANALLKSIIGALRDRDEDKTYLEKYAEKLANNIGSDLIPILNLPGVEAIAEAIQGFTTELPEMGMISDTVSAGNKALKKIMKGDWGGALGELTVVFNLFGLPVRNVYRDFAAIFNTAVNTKPLKDTSFAGIYKAAVEGFLDSSTIYGAGKALGLIDTSKAAGIKKAMRKGDSIEIRKATNKLIKEYVASGKSENEAKGYIKGALTNYWKPLYQNANSTERIKIRKALYATGIYENTDAVVKMCDNWLKDD